MRVLVVILSLLSTTLSTQLAAQMPGGPAKEMGKLDVMLGNWTGTGTVKMDPSQPAMAWQSRMTAKKILGGHYVQEDMEITFEGLPTMLFRNIHTWDPEAASFRSFGASNNGDGVSVSPMYFAGNKLVGSQISDTPNGPVTAHWVTTYEGDSFTIVYSQSRGGEPFGEFVTGSFKRGGSVFSADDSANSAFAPAPEMAKLLGHNGDYKFKGQVSPMAGMPMMDISGAEKIHTLLGGHLQVSEIHGDPMEGSPMTYEGRVLLGWNGQSRCYKAVELSNMGGFSVHDVVLNGAEQIWSSQMTLNGTPVLVRTVAKTTDSGIRVVSHRIAGAAKPEVSFEAFFERLKGERQ